MGHLFVRENEDAKLNALAFRPGKYFHNAALSSERRKDVPPVVSALKVQAMHGFNFSLNVRDAPSSLMLDKATYGTEQLILRSEAAGMTQMTFSLL
jgi:hypothetical protein